ncbi:MAG: hypothetical protein MI923_20820, partial [Phycisphaerales bacterium]|nr:hypothetical protein [Phycisphaerales bacterium]
ATGGLDLLNGNGTDSELKINQSNYLFEDDRLVTPTVENDGEFEQKVTARGGDQADSDDGIDSDDAHEYIGTTGGDMNITAKSIASADATGIAEAFNQDLSVGQNTQSNVVKASIVGNDDVFEDGIDTENLLTTPTSQANIGSDTGNHTDIGDNILNGNGTDTQFEVDQINALSDADVINNPTVTNSDSFTQTVSATGGSSSADDGMDGLFSYGVGDDISIDALAAASADAVGAASAFNQNIVMGANVQANGVDVSIVGGSSAVSMVGDDDA